MTPVKGSFNPQGVMTHRLRTAALEQIPLFKPHSHTPAKAHYATPSPPHCLLIQRLNSCHVLLFTQCWHGAPWSPASCQLHRQFPLPGIFFALLLPMCSCAACKRCFPRQHLAVHLPLLILFSFVMIILERGTLCSPGWPCSGPSRSV